MRNTTSSQRLVPSPHIAILALAAGLRLYRIEAQSLWADEGNSAALAMRSLSRIAQDAAADIHPPLYYWLLHLWASLFGTSETALRSLSVVFGVATVYLIYLIGCRLQGESTGLVAALVAAINPFLIYYAQEARMYAALGFWSALALYTLTLIVLREGSNQLRPSPGLAALLVVALAGGLYTHYTFPAIIAAINVLYLIWLWDSQRRGHIWERMAWWWGLHLVALILFLPWLPIARRQLATWPQPQGAETGQLLGAALVTLSLGPVGYAQPQWPWNILFAAGILFGLWPRMREARGRREHWLAWGIPFLGMAAPIVLIATRGLFSEAYLKFLMAASPGFCLLLARGIMAVGEGLSKVRPIRWRVTRQARYPRHVRIPAAQIAWFGLVAVVIGLVSGQALQRYYFDPAYARDDYRGIARYIEAVESEGDRIILEAPGQQEVFLYYYRGNAEVHPLPRQRPPDRIALEAELAQITARPGRIFALFWAVEQADPERIVESWLARSAFKASEAWRGNVRFAIYAVPDMTVSQERYSELSWTLGDPPLIRLRGAGIGTASIASGEVLPLRLTWEALRPIAQRYKVSIQLLDSRQQVMAQRDAEPGAGMNPTTDWPVGEPQVDSMGILIQPGTPPGTYQVIAAVYDAISGERLMATDGEQVLDHIPLGEVTVVRPATPPSALSLSIQHPRDRALGPFTLMGFDLYKRGYSHMRDAPIAPGDLLHITLYWRADERPGRRYTIRLELGQGYSVVETDPVGDAYPTTAWQEGEVVRGEHDLPIPPDLSPGRYPVFLTLMADGQPVDSRLRLAEIVISP